MLSKTPKSGRTGRQRRGPRVRACAELCVFGRFFRTRGTEERTYTNELVRIFKDPAGGPAESRWASADSCPARHESTTGGGRSRQALGGRTLVFSGVGGFAGSDCGFRRYLVRHQEEDGLPAGGIGWSLPCPDGGGLAESEQLCRMCAPGLELASSARGENALWNFADNLKGRRLQPNGRCATAAPH